MAVHQEAYALWWKLRGAVHKEQEIGNVVTECQNWWVHNRLYLEPEVAEAFRIAYHAAFSHRDYSQAKLEPSKLEENWHKINIAGEIIVKAVQLPSLQEGEYQPLEQEGKDTG